MRDQFLERGDFLVFKYFGNSLFHVKVYCGIDRCKKDIADMDGIGRGRLNRRGKKITEIGMMLRKRIVVGSLAFTSGKEVLKLGNQVGGWF